MSPNQNTGAGQLARKSQPRHDQSFKTLEELTPRKDLGRLLGVSDDPRLIKFVGLLLSPSKPIQRRSLAKLASMCDLPYSELLRTISQSHVSEGILRMSAKVPEVMQSVAENACNRSGVCQECKGSGDVPDRRKGKRGEYRTCHICGGDGTVVKQGSIEAQKMVFESVGLTNRKSPLFNVNVGAQPGALPSVESEMGSMSRVLDIQPEKT